MQQTTTTTITKITTTTSPTSFSTTMTINELYTNTVEFLSATHSSKSVFWETTFAIHSTDRNDSLMNSKDGMTINSFFFEYHIIFICYNTNSVFI